MSQNLSDRAKAGAPVDQHPPAARQTGAGAGTAMEAMLKKRRMQAREPDAAPEAPGPADPGNAQPEQ